MNRYDNKELHEIVKAVRSYIETEIGWGSDECILPRTEKTKDARTGEDTSKEETLKRLAASVRSCRGCGLAKTRNNVVFGSGNARAKLMFVGEAPGFDEDMQGQPFVGRAGQLLTKIIEAMGFKRKDVYIANVIKCRPPQNRNPLPTEVIACEGNLIKQIDIIRPKVICALGKFAAQSLLKTDQPISKLRGRFGVYHGIKVMPTYHPAYLLRNPGDKRIVWQDVKKIMTELKED